MPSIAGTNYQLQSKAHSHQTTPEQPLLDYARLLGDTVVPLHTPDPGAIGFRPPVQVHTRVVAVVLPAAQKLSLADAAVG